RARHKLLVLDIAWPLADARLGLLADDASARLEDELNAVADPHRLVLCSCAPGQVALASEDLGRTVFGYYFEEGLRGWAGPASSRRASAAGPSTTSGCGRRPSCSATRISRSSPCGTAGRCRTWRPRRRPTIPPGCVTPGRCASRPGPRAPTAPRRAPFAAW